MKTNKFKLFAIIALVAIIGFTFAACGKVKTNPESDFEVREVSRLDDITPIDGGKGGMITNYIGNKSEVGIPSKIQDLPVTIIGVDAFREKKLIKVSIPNSVIRIRAYAFRENQLTSVTIPNSVTVIGSQAFEGNQLTSVTIPNSVTKIEQYAFRGNQLTSITIGANVSVDNGVGGDLAFGNGFEAVYNKGGKAAGTYTRPDVNSTTWTKQSETSGKSTGSKSALVGKWVPEEGQRVPSSFIEERLELTKDGTGIGDGMSLKWKVEKGRITFDLVSGHGYAYDYKLSGSTLTLTDDEGTSVKYKKK